MGVLDEIVKSNRMPVLFVGSGISKRYLENYPSWSELLEMSFAKFETDSFQYQKHIDMCKRNKMSEFETNVHMGTVIEKEFNRAFFDRKIVLNIGNKKNPSWVRRGISPYKMYLADYFKKQKLNCSPEMMEELDKFRKLRNKVAAVITTNYDTFLEKNVFSEDFQVFVRQHELFSADSYGIAEIYKIHGSVTDAESIIVGIDNLSEMDFSSKPLAIAIGYKENILNKYGYGLLEESQIFEDIIFNNKNFDAEAMCLERFKGIAKSRLIPVFKYVKNQSIPEGSKLEIYIQEHDALDKIISNNVVKSLKNIPKYNAYCHVKAQMKRENSCRRTAMTVLKNMDVLTVDELRDACKFLHETYPKEYMSETNSKRCILCLDLRENFIGK